MLTHAQHVERTQARRQRELDAIRKRIIDKENAARELILERMRRHAVIDDLRRERERIAQENLRVKMLDTCGDVALTFDEVMSLRPCRRISAVKRMLQHLWDNNIPVTAQQAIDAGCQDADIKWVMYKLERFNKLKIPTEN